MKYLIVGLGNIGPKYHHTRHNIGFDVADAFAAKHNAAFNSDRLADVAICKWKGRTFVVIKPTTFMNLSGKAVKYWMDKEKIPVENILVIVDELALPLDALRLRAAGSDAGHNGLKSIQELLGTNEYPRLRFGIGNNYPKGQQVDFVLGKWPADEWKIVEMKIEKCTEIIEAIATVGIQRAMNTFNNLKFPPVK
jgi:PTH1 family peptidyl-tRNA hydrolase